MKIKNGFILREFAGKWMAFSDENFEKNENVLVTLNKTGAFVWSLLQNNIAYDEVVKKIIEHYDVDEARAKKDFDAFLEKCRAAEIIDE